MWYERTSAGRPSKPVTLTPSRRSSTTWSWPSSIADRVWAMNAETSEARKASPSPTPTTSGEFRRAPTTTSGASACTATSVNAPSRRRHTNRIASARSSHAENSSASRCATTSVSVSEASSCPRSANSARSSAKFSMMPLCTTATRPALSRCGWALASVGPPCVAQRVCPIPVDPVGSGRPTNSFSRLTSFPAFFAAASPRPPTRRRPPSRTPGTPAASARPSPHRAPTATPRIPRFRTCAAA